LQCNCKISTPLRSKAVALPGEHHILQCNCKISIS
jgi:hypothetical protein